MEKKMSSNIKYGYDQDISTFEPIFLETYYFCEKNLKILNI